MKIIKVRVLVLPTTTVYVIHTHRKIPKFIKIDLGYGEVVQPGVNTRFISEMPTVQIRVSSNTYKKVSNQTIHMGV